jgi:hypothetical protein
LRLFRLLVASSLVLTFAVSAWAGGSPTDSAPRLLPEKIGKYKQVNHSFFPVTDRPGTPTAAEEALYDGSDGTRALVSIDRFRQDSQAYAAFSMGADWIRQHKHPNVEIRSDIGTASFVTDDIIGFFKGTSFVKMASFKGSPESLHELAEALNNTLDKGENDIPALIKHLPHPEEARKNAVYLNSFSNLSNLGTQQPVFSAIESDGNADAVIADYGPSKLLIIEFNTPQLAAENDQRIISRIQELWRLGEPAPTAYRRVGNYSVFVFDAPDEQTAKQLIDQVKYEQVVQWLGENPNIFKEAQKRYINTTLGVLVAVLKASGFALITCLGMGGLIGALLFNHRRAQQNDVAAYSDAGGMLRLNLDEMTEAADKRG